MTLLHPRAEGRNPSLLVIGFDDGLHLQEPRPLALMLCGQRNECFIGQGGL
jgi:hypothetical protein